MSSSGDPMFHDRILVLCRSTKSQCVASSGFQLNSTLSSFSGPPCARHVQHPPLSTLRSNMRTQSFSIPITFLISTHNSYPCTLDQARLQPTSKPNRISRFGLVRSLERLIRRNTTYLPVSSQVTSSQSPPSRASRQRVGQIPVQPPRCFTGT